MNVDEIKSQYETAIRGIKPAEQAYAQRAGGSESVPALMQQRIAGRVSPQLREQEKGAQAEYFGAPAALREKYQNVWSPFEREKLIETGRQQLWKKMQTIRDIRSAREGRVADIMKESGMAYKLGTERLKNDYDMKVAEANRAKKLYEFAQAEEEYQQYKKPLQELELKLKEKELAKPYYKPEEPKALETATDIFRNKYGLTESQLTETLYEEKEIPEWFTSKMPTIYGEKGKEVSRIPNYKDIKSAWEKFRNKAIESVKTPKIEPGKAQFNPTASEKSDAQQWVYTQPGWKQEDIDKLSTDPEFFYWVLEQVEPW